MTLFKSAHAFRHILSNDGLCKSFWFRYNFKCINRL